MASQQSDPSFSIQPHPAKSNDPNATTGQAPTDAASGTVQANPGPRILDTQTASQLEKPLSDEELQKRSEELNK
ncbi:hypothetical protein ACI68E_003170 [Malassezia pachydermatis]|uniref:Uncharacterized protein n=1 Tax=Malassezia pachydermatis TaxID=77020 RepID=A0A0M9VP35_9BASI|nr:hypothetical protein Malapachy_3998 [Malassezia pachydermatis]KOS13989.1 hypothetical protein Malapachy_3998 [Malassezia pachydermatis]